MKLAQVDIGSKFGSPFGQTKGFADLVSLVLSNAVYLAGVIVFFVFLFAGFSLLTGAGEQNPEKTAKGKKAMTAAIFGFIIVFASYWIIKIVESLTGVTILSPQ